MSPARGAGTGKKIGYRLGGYLSRLLEKSRPVGESKRILLIKTHAVGDLLMVTPAIRLLRQLRPDAELVFLTGRTAAPVLYGNPHLNEVVTIGEEALLDGRIRALRALAGKMRSLDCGTAVCFHPAWRLQMFVLLAGIPRRFGFDREGAGFSLTHPTPWRGRNDYHYVVGDYLNLAAAAGGGNRPDAGEGMWDLELSLNPGEEREADRILKDAGAVGDGTAVGIAPGGGINPRDRVEEKRWLPERFARLADRIGSELGRPVWLFGSPGEQELVDTVRRQMQGGAVDFSGRTTLRTLACLIRRTGLLVTGDSAPMHMALALGIPLVSLFGPTRASALLPISHARVTAIPSRKECSPCYNNERFPFCNEACSCMTEIEVDEVFNRCRDVLTGTGAGPARFAPESGEGEIR